MTKHSITAAVSALASTRLSVTVGQHSSSGRKSLNQDRMAARLPDDFELAVKGVVLAVADGISSSECSQVAAETAVTAFIADYYATPEGWTTKTSARRVIEAINSWLYAQNRHARTVDMNRGLVCTLTVLILKAREAHIFHVGDSRVSRFSEGHIEPLTEDHVTVVSESEQYLGRAMGAQERVDIDYRRLPLRPGDVFLVSTDGMHEYIGERELAEALQEASLENAAQRLTALAMAAGSPDNLTAQLLRVDSVPDALPPPAIGDDVLPLPGELGPGDSIDGFRLLRDVHRTERSHLLLATDPSGARVALKLPGFEARENPDHLQRFAYEEWIAARIASAHVVKAAKCTQQRSAAYVALQWVEGMTLRQWMHDHPRPGLDEVRAIVEQIVRGLQALHRREMIHQDLRPENIMIDRDGTAVIIDLGSVAVAGIEEVAPGMLGTLPGTYQYTAPEYLSGDIISWRADQFSLAVMTYEMLAGRLPYGANAGRVRSRRDQQRLKYQRADVGERAVPPWVDFALARACHRDPMRRYDVLTEFVADLRSPSARFKPRALRPLAERSPLRFWKGLAFIQALTIGILLILWLRAAGLTSG
ncbi:MAG: protein kinase [Pseudomonadota bacterium]